MWSRIYDQIDVDHDGCITPEEFKVLGLSGNRHRKMWKNMDHDGDGIISRPEFREHFEQVDPQRANELLTMMAAALNIDLTQIQQESCGPPLAERDTKEERPKKEPRAVRNVRKWMQLGDNGFLLNASLLESAFRQCEGEFAEHGILKEARQVAFALYLPPSGRSVPLHVTYPKPRYLVKWFQSKSACFCRRWQPKCKASW